MDTPTWPPADVRLHVDGLVLQLPDEARLTELGALAAAGVHGEDEMPFTQPWTVGTGADRARRTVQYHWQVRGAWTPQRWCWPVVALQDGVVVGMQELSAQDLPVLREVATGSWVGREHQGRGIGTRMRAAVLSFALGTLGAEHATTEAFEDNAASIAVTRRLGYRPDGEDRLVRQGRPARSLRFRLRTEGFSSPWPVRVEGWSAACATAFGLVGEA